MEQVAFQYRDEEICISIKFSGRKTIGICVHPDKTVEVRAPYGTPIDRIHEVIELKSRWIAKQLAKAGKYRVMEKRTEYKAGQTLRLLGEDYLIKLTQIDDFEEERIVKEKKIIRVYVYDTSAKERISLWIQDWYRNEALIFVTQKLEECYQRIKKYDIPRPNFYLKYMKRRWGSCTSKGIIYLNPEMIALPSHCIEYIIMHELCHLKHLNHSKDFYYFLETVMPDWKDKDQALDLHLQV